MQYLSVHSILPAFSLRKHLSSIPSTRRIDHRLSLVNNHVESLTTVMITGVLAGVCFKVHIGGDFNLMICSPRGELRSTPTRKRGPSMSRS